MDKSKKIPTRQDIYRIVGNDPVMIRALEDIFDYTNVTSQEEFEQLQSTIVGSMSNIYFPLIAKIRFLNERIALLESRRGNVIESKKKILESQNCTCNCGNIRSTIDLMNIKREIETIKDFIGI